MFAYVYVSFSITGVLDYLAMALLGAEKDNYAV